MEKLQRLANQLICTGVEEATLPDEAAKLHVQRLGRHQRAVRTSDETSRDDFVAGKVRLECLTQHRGSLSKVPEFALSQINARKASVIDRAAEVTTAREPEPIMAASNVQDHPKRRIKAKQTAQAPSPPPEMPSNEPAPGAQSSAPAAAAHVSVTMATLGVPRFSMPGFGSDSDSMEC